MNAYTVVGPTNVHPRFFKSLLSASDCGVRARCKKASCVRRRGRERGDTILFIANSAGRAERTIELLADYDVFAVPIERAEDAHRTAVLVGTGFLSRGFRLPDAALQLWAETDVFEEERKVHERRRSAARTFLSDFRDLKVDDLVVFDPQQSGCFACPDNLLLVHADPALADWLARWGPRAAALTQAAEFYLQLERFTPNQILETKLRSSE